MVLAELVGHHRGHASQEAVSQAMSQPYLYFSSVTFSSVWAVSCREPRENAGRLLAQAWLLGLGGQIQGGIKSPFGPVG